jgi:D-arabinitol 2-dehydrogenase
MAISLPINQFTYLCFTHAMLQSVMNLQRVNALQIHPTNRLRSCRAVSVILRRRVHPTNALEQADRGISKGKISARSTSHGGSHARTDSSIHVEYPKETESLARTSIQGKGGLHFKRTLASFSLEGRVAVITGGARGLGLVMGQALVSSGADLAIVDLNSMSIF